MGAPPAPAPSGQPCAHKHNTLPPAAVLLDSGSYAHVEACAIEHTASHGLEMLQGSRAHLKACTFESCAGSAIFAYESGMCEGAMP